MRIVYLGFKQSTVHLKGTIPSLCFGFQKHKSFCLNLSCCQRLPVTKSVTHAQKKERAAHAVLRGPTLLKAQPDPPPQPGEAFLPVPGQSESAHAFLNERKWLAPRFVLPAFN